MMGSGIYYFVFMLFWCVCFFFFVLWLLFFEFCMFVGMMVVLVFDILDDWGFFLIIFDWVGGFCDIWEFGEFVV